MADLGKKLKGVNVALTSCEACTAERKAIRLGFGGILNLSEMAKND